MRGSKGAIQMSLGFIIAVVFAVILLSLVIIWLRGMMGGISGLTTDLTQQARNELQRTFGGTGESFSVFPTNYETEAGKGFSSLIGIKNNAADGAGHKFVVNIEPAAASICGDNDLKGCSFGNIQNIYNFMKSWLTWVKTPIQIGSMKDNQFQYKIQPPPNTPRGTYMFLVYACYDNAGTVPSADECNENTPSESVWSTPKQVSITIK